VGGEGGGAELFGEGVGGGDGGCSFDCRHGSSSEFKSMVVVLYVLFRAIYITPVSF
jgi:hypothetical protein